MRQSTLETYVHLLNVLAREGPIKRINLMFKAKVDYRALQQCVDFLIKQKLIEEQTIGKDALFAVTQRGLAVLNYFGEVKQVVLN